MPLTTRQNEILKAIIEEHIECAQPIASIELVKKRGLRVCGATVRNIMSDLVKLGYLKMVHVSSGRTPTDRAYRHYISELMSEDELSVLEEVAIKQKIMSERYELERLLLSTAEVLSEITGTIALAMTSDGYIAYTGTSRILNVPEFFELDVARSVFKLLDDYELAMSVLGKTDTIDNVSVLIGREIELANMEPVSLISSHCQISGGQCYIGMIGPSRIRYSRIIPIVRYVSNLLSEVGENL
ncbi:hypothetical protein A2982_00965 [candidate division WWE3 bacterium RIFCSPLOWO2_01_FULL_39_13]|uniref:Heat-inducible transcription repressor HrcA C-terminal domain-containing protein n=1 Tax=candidate division WWE3 bacterium RIFCSPLOWO2_01_FULL_39_13 TaxID=1802624 RepID=A0A1F4V5J4_UNCKA|nr:MAG: hypothetical protein A2982_00965 [candidate division WWE3 bacterium RIFCSPLOWO2_01_FULL_39_13]